MWYTAGDGFRLYMDLFTLLEKPDLCSRNIILCRPGKSTFPQFSKIRYEDRIRVHVDLLLNIVWILRWPYTVNGTIILRVISDQLILTICIKQHYNNRVRVCWENNIKSTLAVLMTRNPVRVQCCAHNSVCYTRLLQWHFGFNSSDGMIK